MKKRKHIKSTKPSSKEEGKVLRAIDREMDRLLRAYVQGGISDEQMRVETARIQSNLNKENIKRKTLIQLIMDNNLVGECKKMYGVARLEDLSYKKLIEFTKKKELSLSDYRNITKSPYQMTKKELVNCIAYSRFCEMFLHTYNLINVSDASIEDLREFAIKHNLDTIIQGKNKTETKKLREINVLLRIVKDNDMIQEMLEKYELSHISNVSISQLEEFTVLRSLVSKEVFCPLVGIKEEDFYLYRERLEKIDTIRRAKCLKDCLAMYGESSVSYLTSEQLSVYIKNMNR